MKILYVEDNPELREAIGELLEAPDRVVHSCSDAEKALALCATDRFDVVVTDVSLPGISGTELARRLVAARPNQQVVLCSGYDFGDDARVLGAHVRSLPKPFDLDRLEALLAEIDTELQRERGTGEP